MIWIERTREQKRLRGELQRWLDRNIPPQEEQRRWRDPDHDARWLSWRRWRRALWEGRWAAISWPVEYGGRGAGLLDEYWIEHALMERGCPPVLLDYAAHVAGGLLRDYGSQEQRSAFLAPLLSGEQTWCLGLSEATAGSDLHAVATRARAVRGGFEVTGQKKWTNDAHRARWCLALAKTPSRSRGDALSFFIIDMKDPRVRVKRLLKMTGEKNAAEVNLTRAFVPHDRRLGPLNAGWRLLADAAWHERFLLPSVMEALAACRRLEACADLRRRAQALHWTVLRYLAQTEVEGRKLQQACAIKLLASELNAAAAETALFTHGDSRWLVESMQALGHRIGRGTGDIQRNTIARLALGLPADAA